MADEVPVKVGPVLEATPRGRAVALAIREVNPGVELQDRGAYLRVLVTRRCHVTRAGIERVLGEAFVLPRDLEALMPSFKGILTISSDAVEWVSQR